MRTVTLATCTLNQWAMDFEGNCQRIVKTIIEAKQKCATYRCGPELEVTGYGCADHFYENDTFLHSWEVVAQIMKDKRCADIIIDIGMPVMHKNVAYNCRVIFLNNKISLIRPKKKMCNNGIYRESRWFTGWSKNQHIEQYLLPEFIQHITGQKNVPIGDALVRTPDTCIGYEICEELWNPDSSLIKQCFSGAEIIINSSGGFHEIGGTKDVINVIKSATKKCGGIYLFSNLRGCDGDRVYYHGTSHITINGNISAMGEQFSLKDTEVVTATLDLDDVVTYRQSVCKSNAGTQYPQIDIDYCMTSSDIPVTFHHSPIHPQPYKEGEEIALGPACWLWDYLRRSNYDGILLSLEGEIDSCSSAVIVYSMCNLICKAINGGNLSVLSDVRKIIKDPNYIPSSPKDLCNKILITCHLGRNQTHGSVTDDPKKLAEEIGCNYFSIPVNNIIHVITNILILSCNKIFRHEDMDRKLVHLNSNTERIKMITLYIFAEMLTLCNIFPRNVLVLGVGNADKALLGKFVKFGCFSGDVSVTGGISEDNLKKFLKFSQDQFNLTCFNKTNENFESESLGVQNDFSEISKLKKDNCGPYSVFCKLISKSNDLNVIETAQKVKSFFYLYSHNYSKLFSLPPCMHLGSYATVNSYFDQHQLLYNTDWTWQFSAIDKEVNRLTEKPENTWDFNFYINLKA